MKREIATGIQDFESLRLKNGFYVDMWIKNASRFIPR